MDRKDVYKLINGERDYQDARPPRPEGDAITPVSSWLLYIEETVNRAKRDIYNLNKDRALEHIRKIAALAVACMEYNETKSRSN